MRGKTREEWQQEYEINPMAMSGTPVFGDLYRSEIHNAKFQYQKGEVLYRGWDFGYIHPACVISKINEHSQWHIGKEWMGNNIVREHFWKQVLDEQNELYPNAVWYDYADPSGIRKSETSDKSSIEKLADDFGVYCSQIPMQPMDMVEIVRHRLLKRKDGKPNMLVDEKGCPLITEALMGAYVISTTKTAHGREVPKKDGYYEHPVDCMLYIGSGIGEETLPATEQGEAEDVYIGEGKTGY
jgi:hypothetical protein